HTNQLIVQGIARLWIYKVTDPFRPILKVFSIIARRSHRSFTQRHDMFDLRLCHCIQSWAFNTDAHWSAIRLWAFYPKFATQLYNKVFQLLAFHKISQYIHAIALGNAIEIDLCTGILFE